ncbi:MAG: hypothetical protein ACP5I3_10570 [Thermoproteus sp.]
MPRSKGVRDETLCVTIHPRLKKFLEKMAEDGYCSSVSDCVEWLVENYGDRLKERWPV